MSTRVGVGYDSHRFEAGRRFVLGGVEIEHEQGLSGHSDADVLTHAVIDAVLGAAGLGDLGQHFPADDDRWRDADSLDLLTTALGMLSGKVANVDATVIAEQPALAPYRTEMERNLSQTLGAPVSVKATTNEGMGWIGRGEGVACVAVVLLEAAE
jgi:2-C-methyl-D-erythritol 2,4-cyclodiphosphate synthase